MLNITSWIKELDDDLQTAQQLIGPLRHLGKVNWADALANDIHNLREAMEVLGRLKESRGKRRGRPPLWLVKRKKSSEVEAKRDEDRGIAKKASA